jgi:hypothetical protein
MQCVRSQILSTERERAPCICARNEVVGCTSAGSSRADATVAVRALPPSIYHPQGNFAAWFPHAQTLRLRLGWWCYSLSSRSLSRRLSVWAHHALCSPPGPTRVEALRRPWNSFRAPNMPARFTRRCNLQRDHYCRLTESMGGLQCAVGFCDAYNRKFVKLRGANLRPLKSSAWLRIWSLEMRI